MEETRDTLENMMQGLTMGRYNLVQLCLDWLNVFKNTEDAKGLNTSELIRKVLDDVSSGRITIEDIRKAETKQKSVKSSDKDEEKSDDKQEAKSKK